MASTRAGVTLEIAQQNLELWIEASQQLTTHQRYKLGSRELTMADLGEVRRMIEFWESRVTALDPARRHAKRVVLRDL